MTPVTKIIYLTFIFGEKWVPMLCHVRRAHQGLPTGYATEFGTLIWQTFLATCPVTGYHFRCARDVQGISWVDPYHVKRLGERNAVENGQR